MVRCGLVLFLAYVAPVVAIASVAGSTPDPQEDLDGFWRAVTRANRVWLDPSREPLHYRLESRLLTGRRSRVEQQVWVSGARARWRLQRFENEPPRPDPQLEMPDAWCFVSDGVAERYVEGPQMLTDRPARRPRDHRRLRQGVRLSTAMHAATRGLPPGAAVVGVRPREDGHEGQIVVVEADFGEARGDIGLGTYHVAFGGSSWRLGRVRLHLATPELAPRLEEHAGGESRIEFDPDFLDLPNGHAPRVVRHIRQLPLQRDVNPRDWTLELRFQDAGGRWLFDRGENRHGDERVGLMQLVGPRHEPIAPDRFTLPEAASR